MVEDINRLFCFTAIELLSKSSIVIGFCQLRALAEKLSSSARAMIAYYVFNFFPRCCKDILSHSGN
jgi:hypothetical protein